MRLPTFRLPTTGPALAFFLLLPAAHAAEVSAATEVETSPGLEAEAIKTALPCPKVQAWIPRDR